MLRRTRSLTTASFIRSQNAWPHLLALAGMMLFSFWATPAHAQFAFQDLYDFNCQNYGGCEPLNYGSLQQISDGTFIGATGSPTGGLLFNVTTSPPVAYGIPFDFSSPYGEGPAAVSLDKWENIYTVTSFDGAYNEGTLFEFSQSLPFDLHDFTIAEGGAIVPPISGKDGNLYGVTNNGLVYTVVATATSATYKSLGTQIPGSTYGPLYLASDGNLYGTSADGGADNMGTVFRMSTPSGKITTLHSFNGAKGAVPSGPLVQGADGNLYGTTHNGGLNGTGTIYKLTLKGALTKLWDFEAINNTNTNTFGAYPSAGLMAAPDGNFYGVTTQGGANGYGTILQLTSGGSIGKLFDFTGNGGAVPGAGAVTTLALHTNGSFYGLTEVGGANGVGDYYGITPVNLISILNVAGPVFVEPGGPVEILGNDLSHVVQVNFGSVQAQYEPGSDTFLTATVPTAAIDAPISVYLDTGLEIQTMGAVHLLPVITNLDPTSGPVGTQVGIVGGGFAGTTKVTFGGTPATSFTVVTPALIQAIVPSGANSGAVKVFTPNGSAISPEKFTVN